MRARRGCLLAVALGCGAGCRQILGIQDPDVLEMVPDAVPELTEPVAGTYRLRHGGNDASGGPMTSVKIPPPSELVLSAVLDDGRISPVTYDATGDFAFLRALTDQKYRLRAGADGVEYQHAAPRLDIDDYTPGRLDATPVSTPTILQIRLGAVVGTPTVMSTGVWAQYSPPVIDVGNFDVDWAKVAPHGLLRGDLNDRLYVGFYERTTDTQPFTRMAKFWGRTVTLDAGAPTMLTGTVNTVQLSYCFRVVADRAAATTRLKTAMPLFTAVTADWRIAATPIAQSPFLPQLVLAFDPSPTSNTNRDVQFGNPFPGMQIVAGMGLSGIRDVTIPGATAPLRLIVGGVTGAPIAIGPNCTPANLSSTIGIAAAPALAGLALTADNTVIPASESEDLLATWALGSGGPADYTVVLVYEIAVSAGIPALVLRDRVITTSQSATLRRSLFASDKLYVLAVQTVVGVPGAQIGDFAMQADLAGYMLTYSSTFTVAE